MRVTPFLLLSLSLLPFACRPGSAPAEEQAQVDLTDFYEFYQRFHIDSAYQVEHIVFPLKGLPSNADSVTLASDDFFWTADNWKLHHAVDFETSPFTRQLIPLGEGIVEERIVHRDGKSGMLRRFTRFDDEWYLIYFADLNRIKQ